MREGAKIPVHLKKFLPESPCIERYIVVTNGDGNVKCKVVNKTYLIGGIV